MNRTLSIIKPDAISRNISGQVNSLIEKSGLKIIAQKMIKLSLDQAKSFYLIHRDKPFYNDLVNYMISGPVIVQILQGNNAVNKYRKVMGATNPDNAERRHYSRKICNISTRKLCAWFRFS